MKVSLQWLNEYIDIGYQAQQIAEILSDRGFPCEGIEALEDDTVIDVEVTSNRGDCLGHIGIARELASALDKSLTLPSVELEETEKPVSDVVVVKIEAPELCGRYTARVIEGVTIGPSPEWMAKRLEAVGMRSVNNVVDASNYAMLESGQPPHAFDYATITHGEIIVRQAQSGERLKTIDATDCQLTSDMLVIADPKGPVAIAGVMGGLHTEVSDITTTILLEDAHFAPITVRSTSRQLSLPSEAAFRFERTVDIDAIDWASRRAAQLIIQTAGGQVLKGVVDCFPQPKTPAAVSMRLDRLKTLLGIDVSSDIVVKILSSLGFAPTLNRDRIDCTIPSWRSDVSREVDLIEEVIRCYGYDKIQTHSRIAIEVTPVDVRQKQLQIARQCLNACGFFEAINVDFVDDKQDTILTQTDAKPSLSVLDTSRKNANKLRQTLLGSLLGSLKTNVHAKNTPCCLYEISETFVPLETGGLPEEKTRLGMVADDDFRSLRTAVEKVIESLLPTPDIQFLPTTVSWAQVGASIQVNGIVLGQAGVFNERVVQGLEIKHVTPVGAELDFDALTHMKSLPRQVKAIPKFPAIDRDLSIVLAETVPWIDIVAAVKSSGCKVLEDIEFVDIYRGKGVPNGFKSVTCSLRFRDEDGTLTHEAVDTFQATIIDILKQSVKAELRTM